MRLLQVFTAIAIAVGLGATSAYAQSRAPISASCDVAAGVGRVVPAADVRPAAARRTRLFVPPGYDGHQRLPLVLDLHGSGGSSAGQASNSGLESRERQRAVHRRDAGRGGRALECSHSGRPARRRRVRPAT